MAQERLKCGGDIRAFGGDTTETLVGLTMAVLRTP